VRVTALSRDPDAGAIEEALYELRQLVEHIGDADQVDVGVERDELGTRDPLGHVAAGPLQRPVDPNV